MPAYFVVLAIYFLLPSLREYPEMSQPLWKFLLSVQNIALHGGTAFSHAWSLAVEDQFYLVLPFLLLVLYARPRMSVIVACIIVLGGIALRTVLAFQNLTETGVSFRGFQAWIYYPTVDPTRSACAWCCSCRDRKIQTMLVGRTDKPRAVDLVARARSDQLRALVGRRRTPHNSRLRLAISIGCGWYGRTAHLRCESTTAASASCNSRSSLYCQHCLQRLLDSKIRHPRRRRILRNS